MTKIIIFSLVVGILCGYGKVIPTSLLLHLHSVIEVALFILVFGVGMELALNRRALIEVKSWKWRVVFLPLSGMIGSYAASFCVALFFKSPWTESLVVASGFGWYSLSGALVTHLVGPNLGTITFFANLFRELLTFLSAGLVFRYFGDWATVALGGATAMDTTLGPMVKVSDGRLSALALLSGLIHSLFVPALLTFWVKFL
ncbi:MAG: lysine exporter LysO family protein [Candidatus Caldatribacteriaceae bacterium]